ncbi:hypothetical protein LBBP_00712 [Leptospira borgpetersenii serovar Ballum]|uniref:Uncharacterized protein n=1 Tax=Leptospira borgpetersenii serovar Ballum TaxID=280505 RepID=A0A0S2IMZ8_LEPBO|nr:hypothetical protein LBBP_00712 [Leptospira borgpetersenii serovar Ballum]
MKIILHLFISQARSLLLTFLIGSFETGSKINKITSINCETDEESIVTERNSNPQDPLQASQKHSILFEKIVQ